MNPFEVLEIGPDAEPSRIVAAAMRALKKKRYEAREIALAQKMLMDPVSRAAYSFSFFLHLPENMDSPAQGTFPDPEFLKIFSQRGDKQR